MGHGDGAGNPTWKGAVILGILLGITMLTKATGVFYGVVGLVWALWVAIRFRKTLADGTQTKVFWPQVFLMGIVAISIVWAAYGFTIGTTSALPNLPVPAPQHWEGAFFQADNTAKRDVYALGYQKTGRWWWYFPIAFILKNPLPLLIALPFSLLVFIKLRNANKNIPPRIAYVIHGEEICRHIFYHSFSASPIVVLPYLFSPISDTGICYPSSHFCPCVFPEHAGLAWGRLTKLGRILLVGLGLWYAIGTAVVFPNEISFFNELAGGPDQGWRYLTTSNTDWLQGWKELQTWQKETGILFRYTGPEGYLGLSDYGINYIRCHR